MGDEMFNMFGFLALPLGLAMRFMYQLIQNYGWTIILFTFLVRVVMFPLSIAQQKSTARMSAYQPLIQEIQKKWANDKNRQNQEMQKFYEENNLKMTAGCLPTLVNMLVLFGIIAVIQAPLQYIIAMPIDQVDAGLAIVEHYSGEEKLGKNQQIRQAILIGEIRDNPDIFIKGIEVTGEDGKTTTMAVDKEWVTKVSEFKFDFLGLNLAAVPSVEMNRYLILPILSILTMFASQFIIMKFSGTAAMQGKSSMIMMTVVMGAMFGFYAFTVPVAFSLYYTTSNIVMTLQQLIVKRIYDPEKIKVQVQEEIEERKKAKKAKKQVVIREEDGTEVKKEVNESELAKIRLAKARQMDAEKYGEISEQEIKKASDVAKKQDDEKYGLNTDKSSAKVEDKEDKAEKEEVIEDVKKPQEESNTEEVEEATANEEAAKPGRRKRAKQNKEALKNDPEGFAQQELENEKKGE